MTKLFRAVPDWWWDKGGGGQKMMIIFSEAFLLICWKTEEEEPLMMSSAGPLLERILVRIAWAKTKEQSKNNRANTQSLLWKWTFLWDTHLIKGRNAVCNSLFCSQHSTFPANSTERSFVFANFSEFECLCVCVCVCASFHQHLHHHHDYLCVCVVVFFVLVIILLFHHHHHHFLPSFVWLWH